MQKCAKFLIFATEGQTVNKKIFKGGKTYMLYIAKIKSIPLRQAYSLRKLGNTSHWIVRGNLIGIKREYIFALMKLYIFFCDDDTMHISINYVFPDGGRVFTSEGQIYSLTELEAKYPKLLQKKGKMVFFVNA